MTKMSVFVNELRYQAISMISIIYQRICIERITLATLLKSKVIKSTSKVKNGVSEEELKVSVFVFDTTPDFNMG
jgi:hypothetical protein